MGEQDIEYRASAIYENFAPDIELQAFEETSLLPCCKIKCWSILLTVHSFVLKRYPDRGELYYEILTKQFIYRFNSTEKELLEELNIERSVFYDRKREAIYLIFCLPCLDILFQKSWKNGAAPTKSRLNPDEIPDLIPTPFRLPTLLYLVIVAGMR